MDHTHPLVTGELERIKRADAPLRERSRCLTLVRTKVSYRTLHPEHLPNRDGLGPLVVRAHTWTLQKALSRSFSRSVWYAWSTAIVCKKRRSYLLLHMPCHLSKIQGLRWQGGSLERGCLAHSEISWLSSLAQGASPHSHFHAPQCQHN